MKQQHFKFKDESEAKFLFFKKKKKKIQSHFWHLNSVNQRVK